jgi:hypothetical protein
MRLVPYHNSFTAFSSSTNTKYASTYESMLNSFGIWRFDAWKLTVTRTLYLITIVLCNDDKNGPQKFRSRF